MKITKRSIAFVLILSMIAFCCIGCGPKSPPPPSSAPTSAVPSFGDDTLIISVDGSPVYWPEFKYWLNFSLQYCGFTPGAEIDWDSEFAANMTLAEYVMYDAVNAVALYRVIDKMAEAMNVPLTEEDNASIETIMAENAAYFESQEEYEAYLESSCLNEELMEYLLAASCNYYNIFVKMFGVDGELIPDSDAIAFGMENGYFRAKHILMSFTDTEGNPYSEEEMQVKYAELEDILSQIMSSDDPNAAFDSFMMEYSEDPGIAAYPNGYQYVKGDMASEFQAAVEALDDYGISDIVTMADHGYSIIMRLPLDPDEISVSNPYGGSLRYQTANLEFETIAGTWALEANIEYSESYSKIDLEQLF